VFLTDPQMYLVQELEHIKKGENIIKQEQSGKG
jgi:hypothetical protein